MSARRPTTEDLAFVADWRRWYPAAFSIRNLQGQIVPFEPAPAQVELFETIQELQRFDDPRPVRIMYLKARRVRMSTAVAAAISRVLWFVPGQTAIVVAHNLQAASDIFGYYRTFHETYNASAGKLRILGARFRGGDDPSAEIEGGGWLRVHSATSVRVPRGMSVRMVHQSETAFWPDPELTTAGLLQGVPNDPWTMVFDESTPNGAGTPHHQDWDRRSAGGGAGGWVTRFFGWNRNPVNRMDLGPGEAAEIAESLKGPWREEPIEARHAREFSLTAEQIKWRRHVLAGLCAGNPEMFAQEYPISAHEAFLASGRSRFSSQMMGRQPINPNAIIGEIVMERIGAQTAARFQETAGGALWVSEQPVHGKRYAIGVDVAGGRENSPGDPDYTVFQVLDLDSGFQVARFRARVNPWEAASYLYTLACWYNDAFLAVESNGEGRALIREMLEKWRVPTSQFYMARRGPHQPRGEVTLDEIGWVTSSTSKPVLISAMEAALMEGLLYVRDPVTHSEMRTFVFKENGKQEAQRGCHDDAVMSLAIAWQGVIQAREKLAFERAREEAEHKRRREIDWAVNRQRAAKLAGVERARW